MTLKDIKNFSKSDKEKLRIAAYRQKAATSLVEIIIYPEKYFGLGRLYIP